MATNHDELDEVIELFRYGQNDPAYCMTAISTGEVDIIDSDGACDVTAGLGAALARVEQREATSSVVA